MAPIAERSTRARIILTENQINRANMIFPEGVRVMVGRISPEVESRFSPIKTVITKKYSDPAVLAIQQQNGEDDEQLQPHGGAYVIGGIAKEIGLQGDGKEKTDHDHTAGGPYAIDANKKRGDDSHQQYGRLDQDIGPMRVRQGEGEDHYDTGGNEHNPEHDIQETKNYHNPRNQPFLKGFINP